jgi:hypothetical protein
MALKKLNKSLADHSSRAQDTDGKFVFHGLELSSVQEDGLGLGDGPATWCGLRRKIEVRLPEIRCSLNLTEVSGRYSLSLLARRF